MARWTQYIGLSPDAHEFLSKHKHAQIAQWKMCEGLVGEDVTGSIYEVYAYETIEEKIEALSDGGYTQPSTWAEVEDVTLWSSGPMIHTALRNLRTGEVCFKWKDEEIHRV